MQHAVSSPCLYIVQGHPLKKVVSRLLNRIFQSTYLTLYKEETNTIFEGYMFYISNLIKIFVRVKNW